MMMMMTFVMSIVLMIVLNMILLLLLLVKKFVLIIMPINYVTILCSTKYNCWNNIALKLAHVNLSLQSSVFFHFGVHITTLSRRKSHCFCALSVWLALQNKTKQNQTCLRKYEATLKYQNKKNKNKYTMCLPWKTFDIELLLFLIVPQIQAVVLFNVPTTPAKRVDHFLLSRP